MFAAPDSRTAYLNAAGAATDTTNIVLGALDRVVVGCRYNGSSRGLFAHGIIAECAIWSYDLSAVEINALAAGESPLNIRPYKLVFYAPLYGFASPEISTPGGLVLSASEPTAAVHPRILCAGRSVANVI